MDSPAYNFKPCWSVGNILANCSPSSLSFLHPAHDIESQVSLYYDTPRVVKAFHEAAEANKSCRKGVVAFQQ